MDPYILLDANNGEESGVFASTFKDLQKLIGGKVQFSMIIIAGRQLMIFFDQEGRQKNLPINQSAQELLGVRLQGNILIKMPDDLLEKQLEREFEDIGLGIEESKEHELEEHQEIEEYQEIEELNQIEIVIE